jgi:hypothetical protein
MDEAHRQRVADADAPMSRRGAGRVSAPVNGSGEMDRGKLHQRHDLSVSGGHMSREIGDPKLLDQNGDGIGTLVDKSRDFIDVCVRDQPGRQPGERQPVTAVGMRLTRSG